MSTPVLPEVEKGATKTHAGKTDPNVPKKDEGWATDRVCSMIWRFEQVKESRSAAK